jgi:hypothetical protein
VKPKGAPGLAFETWDPSNEFRLETPTLLFVIRSALGFPTSPLSPATTYVVLPKENHMQFTEAATLDRKSGEAEGSAVLRTLHGNVSKAVINQGTAHSVSQSEFGDR